MIFKTSILTKVVLCLMLLITGCTSEEPNDGASGETEFDATAAYEIDFHRGQIFGEGEKDLIGRINSVHVDQDGRVYMSDSQQMVIHRFSRDGTYEGTFGGRGDGPGEFQTIKTLKVSGDRIYVLDQNRQMIQLFSSDDLSHVQTINLDFSQRSINSKLESARVSGFNVQNNGDLLLEFGVMHSAEDRELIYVMLNDAENLASEPLLIVQDVPAFADRSGDIPIVMVLPFARRTLVAYGENDQIYAAWSEEFQIDRVDRAGDRETAIAIPFHNAELNRREVIDSYSNEQIRRSVSNAEFPETWPALQNMLADDSGRLWIATFVDDASVHEWWVLDSSGELVTKFEWPREESIEVIKNDYIYTRQTDEETGLQQVVRYRVELEEAGGN